MGGRRVAALLTAFYMTRQVCLVFYGNERLEPDPVGRRSLRPADPTADERSSRLAGQRSTSSRPDEPTVAFGEPPRAIKVSTRTRRTSRRRP